ncbi:aromatic ring-hydroxylating oxygenase subunit alpha [Hydrogenophaga sp. PBL-H3]|uniref:aromatic ring-hydroxylating oxygenase subunit alpha n=1 Tax=Hydrogenophaga sp. PBL-H3 TaxID=434010 RepID=UPI00131FBEDF|nr:aromatic ring-hydroxylating dioxygenase subunit alpha [Hydrogenophaga sp. PBL-H3]QHE78665.1 aromatic ring-hydroxylating dioxygenase subunit alpha [Hydrogenophaga sp. PBL-H3]QHE83090.1 aromatic ring-hydroxylating dioxygenase subunit alpha [Hydrogenophaga sp. PBL-H3]
MPRTATQWLKPLNVPSDHYVSTKIYTDPSILAKEREAIFGECWKFACHESEIANAGDYRTSNVAGIPIVILRGNDGEIRTFVNACPHRGASLVTGPRGNAKALTCFFHLWSFNQSGECISITRPEGYEEACVKKDACGLRSVATAVKLGMVFVNLSDEAEDFDTYVGDIMDCLEEPMGTVPLEVFHYHQVVVSANWKQWQETNMELYHEWGHTVNRATSIAAKGYHERKWKIHPNGHGSLEPFRVAYENYSGWEARESLELPGLTPGEFRVVDLFPNTSIIIRATSIRIDTTTPLAPGLTLLEQRGVGVKGESESDRAKRRNQHNQLWGPLGRNLPEDVIFVEAVNNSVRHGASPFGLFARHENLLAQDDEIMRCYYRVWGDRMGRAASNPLEELAPSHQNSVFARAA